MEANLQPSSPGDNSGDPTGTPVFRKPSNDSGSKKYRRRSPAAGSSSSDESPIRDRITSPPATKKDHEKASNGQRRKDRKHELDRDSGRNLYGRGGDSYRLPERQSSRSSQDHYRHDDDYRRNRYGDDADRDYSRSSRHSSHSRKENAHRSRDYERDYEKCLRDKSERLADRSRDREKGFSHENQKHKDKDSSSDRAGSGCNLRSPPSEDIKVKERDICEDKEDKEQKTVLQRSSEDHKTAYEDFRRHRNDSNPKRDSSGHRQKETRVSDNKSQEDEKLTKQQKNSDERSKHSGRYHRESEEQFDKRNMRYTKDQDYSAKKPKLFGSNGSGEGGADVIKEKAVSKWSTNPNSAQDPTCSGTSEATGLADSDIDAAKLAAVQAAALVNHNLIGTGCLTADQKKKLLWGNKKTARTEEHGHRWDTTVLGDVERQEKFQKLMGVKGEVKVEHKAEDHNVEKQREQLQMDLEKQYTAGLRRRDGRTVGLGL